VNFPLLQLPAYLGSATYGVASPAATATTTAAAPATGSSVVNYLATLPKTPTVVSSGLPSYTYGTYGYYEQDVDPQRQAFYDRSKLFQLDTYTFNMTGYQPLNLSDPNAVAGALYWAPRAVQLAAWQDANSTTAASATTTAAATTAAASPAVASANVYYAANPGNIQNIGYAGIGMQVPGPAPIPSVQPGLNLAYQVASPSSSSSGSSAASPSSSSLSYAAPAASSVSSYGRRRRSVAY
jgi:hypothetical protein